MSYHITKTINPIKNALLVLMLGSFLLACRKDTVGKVEPLPAVSYNFKRTIYYPADKASDEVSYTTDSAKLSASLQMDDHESLILDFTVPYPDGHDNLVLNIDKSRIKSGYKGDYTIKANGTSDFGDISTFYNYQISNDISNSFFPGSSFGRFTIESFDDRNQTASGSFNITIASSNDPVQYPSKLRQSSITLNGDFSNLKIMKPGSDF